MTASTLSPICRVCSSARVVSLGPVVHFRPTFAGTLVDLSDLEPEIYRCDSCAYQFVHPPIPESRLLELYRNSPLQVWGDSGARLFAEKKCLLDRFSPGPRVLDLGCSRGDFLAYLGERYQRFGVEPSERSAVQARAVGIDVIAPTLDAAAGNGERTPMDAVVSLDVFEHLLDPVQTLVQVRALLRPNGVVLIETGDSDSPLWRRHGTLYSYCGSPEHMGFFNERSISEAANRAGFELIHFQPSFHHVERLNGRVKNRIGYMAYLALRAIYRLGLPMPGSWRGIASRPVPRLPQVKDHFLAVLQLRDGKGRSTEVKTTPTSPTSGDPQPTCLSS